MIFTKKDFRLFLVNKDINLETLYVCICTKSIYSELESPERKVNNFSPPIDESSYYKKYTFLGTMKGFV